MKLEIGEEIIGNFVQNCGTLSLYPRYSHGEWPNHLDDSYPTDHLIFSIWP